MNEILFFSHLVLAGHREAKKKCTWGIKSFDFVDVGDAVSVGKSLHQSLDFLRFALPSEKRGIGDGRGFDCCVEFLCPVENMIYLIIFLQKARKTRSKDKDDRKIIKTETITIKETTTITETITTLSLIITTTQAETRNSQDKRYNIKPST